MHSFYMFPVFLMHATVLMKKKVIATRFFLYSP